MGVCGMDRKPRGGTGAAAVSAERFEGLEHRNTLKSGEAATQVDYMMTRGEDVSVGR